VSSQKFTASEREAIWSAHEKKCAYTRELLDVSNFHIDHIIPETLTNKPTELAQVKTRLGLALDFDVLGYENLLPCSTVRNLQKGSVIFADAHIHYFLGIASSKISIVKDHLEKIEKRGTHGKTLILLQQCLDRGELTLSEVVDILEKYTDRPEGIFNLIEKMQFSDANEISVIAKSDIESLLDRPIKFGQNDHIDSLTLTNDANERICVQTCREYITAINDGFYALTTFDMKMATFFVHQGGLLQALQTATTPQISFIANPKVGIFDLELIPFSIFPHIGEYCDEDISITEPIATYQSKVNDGTIVIKQLRQNLLQVSEPEGMGHQLVEVVRADFNGNGIEDILVFSYSYATHGTLGFGGVLILTRTTADGMFELVQ
jgi:hypothetical protein